MTQEALKLALEALEESKTNNDSMEFHDRKNKAITAIKEALAQPEQEPVAWVCYGVGDKKDIDFEQYDVDALPVGTNLYTTPPQRTWIGLTDEEVANFASRLWPLAEKQVSDRLRAIEAKLKEKNNG